VLSVAVNGGFEDPAATLWMVMLSVQSLPYAATVATAALSAMSNAGRAKTPELSLVPQPTPPEPEPEPLAKAA
jgi:hypothetical protein